MIKVICVGKIKEQYFKDSINEYLKRLQKYTKIEIIEVQDSKTDNPNQAILEEEELIIKHLKEKDFIISLAIEGKQYNSIEFSKIIENTLIISSNIVFIIGGSCGLSEKIKEKSNKIISFSKQTFPHQLFRIMLLEQIYRAFRIINNETYHK